MFVINSLQAGILNIKKNIRISVSIISDIL